MTDAIFSKESPDHIWKGPFWFSTADPVTTSNLAFPPSIFVGRSNIVHGYQRHLYFLHHQILHLEDIKFGRPLFISI